MESSMPSGPDALVAVEVALLMVKQKGANVINQFKCPSIFLGISVVYIFEILWTLEISAVNWFCLLWLFPVAMLQAVCRRLKAACRQCGRIFEPGDLENWQTQQPMREVEKLGPDGQRFGSNPNLWWIVRLCKTSGCCSQATDAGQRVSEFPSTCGFWGRSGGVNPIVLLRSAKRLTEVTCMGVSKNAGFPQQPWLFLPKMISTWGVKWGVFHQFRKHPHIVILQIPKVEYSMFKVISI